MVLEFLNVIPAEKRIDKYAQILFAEEAPGILRKAVEGAIVHLAELMAGGNFVETERQKGRVDRLLARAKACATSSSNSSTACAAERTLSEELVSAYIDYCNDRNWRPYGIKQVERALPDIMMAIHGVHVGAHIMRDGKRVRGYPHAPLPNPMNPRTANTPGPTTKRPKANFDYSRAHRQIP